MLSVNQRVVALAAVNAASRASSGKAYGQVSEGQTRLRICKMMLYSGWWGGKKNTQGTYLKRYKRYIKDPYLLKGVPDLSFFKGEWEVAIEVKAGKNVQSDDQIEFQTHFHNPKMIRFYILAYDWEDVEKVLDGENIKLL